VSGDGDFETYGTPIRLAKAITVDLAIDILEATLFADDGPDIVVKEWGGGNLTINVNDIGDLVAQDLTGATIDGNGVLVSTSEDGGDPVAVGFRAKKGGSDTYRYFWLYKVKFATPSTSLQTKGDTITFQTPTIVGTLMRRNRPDARGQHPWKVEATESPAIDPTIIKGWYTSVYEPDI